MKKLFIPCMVLILSASCTTHTIADDILDYELTTEQPADITPELTPEEQAQLEYERRDSIVGYISDYLDPNFVIETGKYFLEMSQYWGEDYTLPEDILADINDRIYVNRFFGYLNAVNWLRATYPDIFGDTLEESVQWEYWVEYMDLYNKLISNYE